MRHAGRPTLIALTTGLVLGLGAATAAAAPPGPETVADDLVTPLTFAALPDGSLVVGEAFAGLLTHVDRRGDRTVLHAAPEGTSVTAVSVHRRSITWAERTEDEATHAVGSAVLMRRSADGTVTELADILAYEEQANPDADNVYGFLDLDPACAELVPPFLQPYPGQVDSNPYGSVSVRGVTYVADAGANAILRVTDAGEVSTVAVLPPVEITVTAALAEAFELPDCVVGATFAVEPVPTDVDLGRHGELYVTTLPGGPEDDSLGANGAVYRVDPRNGAVTLVAQGFVSATGLAVAPTGTVYVAELFAGRVSAVATDGSITHGVLQVSQPAAVEWVAGRLHVSVDALGQGRVVRAHLR